MQRGEYFLGIYSGIYPLRIDHKLCAQPQWLTGGRLPITWVLLLFRQEWQLSTLWFACA